MSFDFNIINDTVEKHMSEQPYKAICAKCGTEITGNISIYKIHFDGDIEIEITPCFCCSDDKEE